MIEISSSRCWLGLIFCAGRFRVAGRWLVCRSLVAVARWKHMEAADVHCMDLLLFPGVYCPGAVGLET